jgi:DNA-binding CsgD family transcriptional regulator
MMTLEHYLKELSEFHVSPQEVNSERAEFHLPLLQQLDLVTQSSVALFDMSTLGYRFLTGRFKFLLGGQTGEARQEGIAFFARMMNPDDLELFFDTSLKSFRFLMEQPLQERKNYKCCQDFRMRRMDGTWIRMTQQNVILELSDDGKIWLVLIINDLSPLKDTSVPARRYMEYLPTGERVLFPPEEAAAESPITARELEVLGLISRGFHSRDIADYLGISISTVNNHRQHILTKLGAVNSSEALFYARDLNLIED